MRFRFAPMVAACFATAAITAGCGGKVSASRIETRSETKASNPDGSHATTTTESKQFGSTLVSRTERTENNGKGKRNERSTEETVVGTVTDFSAGKHIVILTGDGSKHDYNLSDKKTNASVDRRVTVGTKVELDSTRDDSGNRSIRVIPAA